MNFIVPNTNVPSKVLLRIHSTAKLQVKWVLNKIHDFFHSAMRKGTARLKKATPSTAAEVKG